MTRQLPVVLSHPFRAGALLGLTAVALVLDQVSKVYATAWWKGTPPLSFFADIFRIEYAENHGAFLSLLANTPDEVRFWILTVINGVVLVGLAAYLLAAPKVAVSTFLPLLLVVAGGIGNLVDRIRFGYVIDFLNLGLGNVRTGIFNVADMFITAGFILMAWMMLFGEHEAEPLPTSADTANDSSRKPAHTPSLPGQGSA